MVENAKNPKKKFPMKTTDSRFQTSNDPRFLRLPIQDKKIKIDKRFTKFVNHNLVHKPNQVDSVGRPYNSAKYKSELQNELSSYYYVEENDSEDDKASGDKTDLPDSKNIQIDASHDYDEGEGDTDPISTDDEGESDLESDLDETFTIWNTYKDDIQRGEASSRLAIMGCEWHYITAVDILVLLQSFNPSSHNTENNIVSIKTPGIDRVAIYPSEYGLQQLEKEKTQGPILDEEENIELSKTSSINESKSIDLTDKNEDIDLNKIYKSTEEEEKEQQEKLRKYQYKRSYYYYAVITCTSKDVATKLYDELDGLETDIAINGLDLRFIPEDLSFPYAPISEATEIPANYEAPVVLGRSALRHVKVKCSWDEPEAERAKFFSKTFTDKELEQMDIDAFIGSEDDFDLPEDEDGVDAFRRVDEKNLSDYRKTLLEGLLSDDDDEEGIEEHIPQTERYLSTHTKNPKNLEKQDLKISFPTKLQSLTIAQESKAQHAHKDDDSTTKHTQKHKTHTHTHAQTTPLTEHQKADLDLLTMDSELDRHFDMREEIQNKKLQKKNKKSKKHDIDNTPADAFKINTEDPRFSKLFTHSNFAIDPTHPQYRDTESNKTLLKLKRKKSKADKLSTAQAVSTSINSDLKLSNYIESDMKLTIANESRVFNNENGVPSEFSLEHKNGKIKGLNKAQEKFSNGLTSSLTDNPVNDIVLVKKRKKSI